MNNNEPVVLGKIKKGKTGRPLVVLIIFLFAGAVVFFLPTITEYFGDENIISLIKEGKLIDFFVNHENYVNDNKIVSTTTKKLNSNEPKLINSKTIIEYNNFNLSNFNLTRESIEFKINTSNAINFDDSQYYLILEKDKIEIVIKLTGEKINELVNTFKFETPLVDTLNVKGYVKIINDKEYPEFTLSSDESGTASLICIKDNATYEYMFNNNLLNIVKETYNYTDNGNNEVYYQKYQGYTLLMDKIHINGGISTLEESYDGFIFKTEVDLNLYQDKINSNYYSLNTKSNKINFEMKAKGYDCK